MHPTEKGKLTRILNKLSENWFYIVNLYISVHIFKTLWLAVLSYRPFSFGKTGKIVIATTFIACLYMWLLNHPSVIIHLHWCKAVDSNCSYYQPNMADTEKGKFDFLLYLLLCCTFQNITYGKINPPTSSIIQHLIYRPVSLQLDEILRLKFRRWW